jgi:hypothetical protein
MDSAGGYEIQPAATGTDLIKSHSFMIDNLDATMSCMAHGFYCTDDASLKG